ncbi:MAG: DNA gyrase subunit B [Clostridiales bacterium]|nr:DNA gyrase subunit B [Clostridiales bacterium]
MAANYNSKDIVVLQGLDAVRLRPGMYIGTTGIKGMHHLLWEIVDNAIDEIANGYGNKITITIHTDNSVTVKDNGRGIPVDKHPTLKVSGVQVVFTQLHAGGKFNNSNYSYSGGLHGVGASVTNALSEWLKVEVCREGQRYFMEFKAVKKSKDKISGGVPVTPLQCLGPTTETGTTVTFKPDDRIFKDCLFDRETIAKRVRELAFLNKGIVIELIDENQVEELGDQVRVYNYTEGLKEFIRFINEKNTVIYKEPIYIEAKTNLIELTCAIQHVDLYSENVFSYVNNIPTPEGGMHETGLKSGITKAFNEIARNMGLLKEKDQNLLGEDYREGMTVVLAIKMKNVQFEGQTKTKLGNPEARLEVENIIYDGLINFANQTSSKPILTEIINKAKGAAKVRDAARKAKEITRQKNSVDSYSLIGKLSSCTGRNPLLNEVFIVEGDSAGGSAKQARDRSFQAILPLRGKPLNVEKKRLSQVLDNEEIRTIISALGTGIGSDFNIEHLKYNKVIIMADADQDGAHIRAILLTFFYRYMRELINAGHVYVAIAPLYKIYKKGFEKYVYDEADYDDVVKEAGPGYNVTRFKGLGEMSYMQLWETTMNPSKRVLIRVTIDDVADAEEMITTLMGDNIEARKKYITANANFNKVDKFEERSKK